LQNEAENYFLHTNYMNKRILQDVIHVRESYEDAWNHLNQKDREQAINDEIILPEVVLKHEQRGPEIKSYPQLRIIWSEYNPRRRLEEWREDQIQGRALGPFLLEDEKSTGPEPELEHG